VEDKNNQINSRHAVQRELPRRKDNNNWLRKSPFLWMDIVDDMAEMDVRWTRLEQLLWEEKIKNLLRLGKKSGLGAGSAVVNLSASEGIMVDDSAVSLALSSKIMVPLVGNKVAYPVCEKKEAHRLFMTLGELVKHFSLQHVDTPIQYGRISCGRNFLKHHAAR
jgi:hypothetical protein